MKGDFTSKIALFSSQENKSLAKNQEPRHKLSTRQIKTATL